MGKKAAAALCSQTQAPTTATRGRTTTGRSGCEKPSRRASAELYETRGAYTRPRGRLLPDREPVRSHGRWGERCEAPARRIRVSVTHKSHACNPRGPVHPPREAGARNQHQRATSALITEPRKDQTPLRCVSATQGPLYYVGRSFSPLWGRKPTSPVRVRTQLPPESLS
jgi:hypothetical protein